MRVLNPFKRLIKYFREVWEEMRKITWPTREQTIRYALIVIAVSVGVAVFLGLLDFVFSLGLQQLLTLKH